MMCAVRGRRLIVGEAEIGTPTAGIAPLGDFMHTAIGSRMRICQEGHMEVSPGH
jgi:hypothetical protein